MSGSEDPDRTIRVDRIARVEGEGALRVTVKDGRVDEVRLSIFEAPRFFERFLEGRHISELPDLVARICGICPVAYQMSAVHAVEQILGVTVEGPLRDLRRLLYCGEWIESHALHVFLLHAPDFFGYESGLEMAKDYPDLVRRGLELRKAGNAILALLGGRAIHPVSVRVGGFSRVPTRRELAGLKDMLLRTRDAAAETVRWVAGFDFPAFAQAYTFVALRSATEYPMNQGQVASTDGFEIPVAEFERHFVEHQVDHSHALQCSMDGRSYMVGPLARLHLNYDRLSAVTRDVLADARISLPLRNPYQAVIARAAEMLHAADEALRVVDTYEPPPAPSLAFTMKSGTGTAATEAPRGLLYHRYAIDEDGTIRTVVIVPPTSQNQRRMEDDLRAVLPGVLDLDNEAAARACERVIRCYDPCISCATHFLRLEVTHA